jgi:hypothetical protein
VLSEIAVMIETAGLQIGAGARDFGKRGLGQNLGRDIVDRGIRDLVNEADVLVFAGSYALDHPASGDFRIDDGLAPAPPIVDHYNEILHGGSVERAEKGLDDASIIYEKQNPVKLIILKKGKIIPA